MEQALKNATEANAKSMDIITEKDKTISAKDAEIEKLKSKLALAEKAVPVTNLSDSPTATDKEPKELTYRAPRTIMNAIYPTRKLDEVTVKITDKKKIQELESNGYRIAS